MIVIGASLGGLRALSIILSGLEKNFSLPIAIVVHRAKDTSDLLASVLQVRTSLPVSEVVDKDPIIAGHVYLAPPDYHLMIDREQFSLSIEAPVNYARPAIDVLFESAADMLGANVIAVVLTGSSADGAAGAAAVAARGGRVIIQDPISAESPIMPSAALARIPAAQVLLLPEIAGYLNKLTSAA